MSQRRPSERWLLPETYEEIEFTSSDGNRDNWPTNITQVVDKDGQVNFMKPVGLQDSIAVKWRRQVGESIANKFQWSQDATYVLKDWPAGFAMFDHHKGSYDKPRHDIYLFGGKARYRSVPEFVPHAIWLLDTRSSTPCECKYCSNTKSQKLITQKMASHGILPARLVSPSPQFAPTVRKPRERPKQRLREQKVFAQVQKATKPSPNVVTSEVMLEERHQDLRSIRTAEYTQLRRLYRVGEVVWCEISPPIESPLGPEGNIILWPGIIDEDRVKITTRLVNDDTSAYRPTPQSRMTGGVNQQTTEPPPWEVNHEQLYTIRLLGIKKILTVSEASIVPQLAYGPSDAVINGLNSVPAYSLDFDQARLDAFDPTSLPPFADAIAPFALAIQTGSTVAKFWTVTDQWEYRALPQHITAPPPPPQSLSDAINAASSANSLSASANGYTNRVGDPSTRPSRTFGDPPIGLERNQVRFQGLWWGGERIWVNDFVRLKIPRSAIAPQGDKEHHIYAASGFGKSVAEHAVKYGVDPTAMGGAQERGVFMSLDRLFLVETKTPDGKVGKECRASGMLYEVADIDWEETEPENLERMRPDVNVNEQAQSKIIHPTLGSSNVASSSSIPQPPTSTSTVNNAATNNLIPTPTASTSNPPNKVRPESKSFYPLPVPPRGYWFRPILSPEHEMIISLTLLSGRYYPRILEHPILRPFVANGMAKVPDPFNEDNNANDMMNHVVGITGDMTDAEKQAALQDARSRDNYLWALDGLAGGYANAVDPVKFISTRREMLDLAAKEALQELLMHKQNSTERKQDEDEVMGEVMNVQHEDKDVDELPQLQQQRHQNGTGQGNMMDVDPSHQ